MIKNRKPRPLGRGRASEKSAWTADRTEDSTEALIGKQAARILRRFSVSPALAVTIAELAFQTTRETAR